MDRRKIVIYHDSTFLDHRMFKNIQNIRSHKLYHKTIENWQVESSAGKQTLADVKILRGILQIDLLSPQLFVIANDATV